MDFKPLTKLLSEHSSFLIAGHINPDGDSIGALLSMGIILREHFGKEDVRLLSKDGVPGFLTFLPGAEKILTASHADLGRLPDLAILVDCGSPPRTGEQFKDFFEKTPLLAIVDHHIPGGVVGNVRLIDHDASSTCEVIHRFVKSEGIKITPDLATCLYEGIMYDTGRFMHSNTTPEVFHICSDLVAHGANPTYIAVNTFNKRSLNHLKLLGYALSNLQTIEDGEICYIVVDGDMREKLGASPEDFEGIVDEIGKFEKCEVHIVFSKAKDGMSRASMRSHGLVNVEKICSSQGGGGHKFASGLRTNEPLDEVVKKSLALAVEQLRELKKS